MPRQLGESLQSERGSLPEQRESDMSLKFTAGDLTIHRLIEEETTFLPVHDLFAGLTPDLLAENRRWLRDSGATDDTYMRALKAAGFAVEDIDFVMCTHLHVDQVGWNTRLEGGPLHQAPMA